jgi:hypothetical protein
MAHESIQRPRYEAETSLSDSHVTFSKPRRETVTRVTEALREVGTLGLLVILAAGESVRHRQAPSPDNIEQLREFGDWVD